MVLRILFFGLLLSLVGCAAVKKDFQERTCHYDGAFQKGANEAQAGEAMNAEQTVSQCPDSTAADVRKGYRDGYIGVKSTPAVVNANVASNAPKQECLDAYGKRACGYSCKEAYGKLKCAKIPGNTCTEAYGNITCGTKCRNEHGKIRCDSYE